MTNTSFVMEMLAYDEVFNLNLRLIDNLKEDLKYATGILKDDLTEALVDVLEEQSWIIRGEEVAAEYAYEYYEFFDYIQGLTELDEFWVENGFEYPPESINVGIIADDDFFTYFEEDDELIDYTSNFKDVTRKRRSKRLKKNHLAKKRAKRSSEVLDKKFFKAKNDSSLLQKEKNKIAVRAIRAQKQVKKAS